MRLYGYQDLLALLVVSALRTEWDMSLQTIRRVVRHLRSRGYNEPLRELRFATGGREIYFQHPDGTLEGQPDGPGARTPARPGRSATKISLSANITKRKYH